MCVAILSTKYACLVKTQDILRRGPPPVEPAAARPLAAVSNALRGVPATTMSVEKARRAADERHQIRPRALPCAGGQTVVEEAPEMPS